MESAQFFERVNKNGPTVPYVGTPCWQWIGGAAGEYGGAWFERRQELAHSNRKAQGMEARGMSCGPGNSAGASPRL